MVHGEAGVPVSWGAHRDKWVAELLSLNDVATGDSDSTNHGCTASLSHPEATMNYTHPSL